jgi:hypothetical protein
VVDVAGEVADSGDRPAFDAIAEAGDDGLEVKGLILDGICLTSSLEAKVLDFSKPIGFGPDSLERFLVDSVPGKDTLRGIGTTKENLLEGWQGTESACHNGLECRRMNSTVNGQHGAGVKPKELVMDFVPPTVQNICTHLEMSSSDPGTSSSDVSTASEGRRKMMIRSKE